MGWFSDWFRRSDSTAARIGRGSIFRGGRLRGEAADRVVRRQGATRPEAVRASNTGTTAPSDAAAAAAVGGAILLGAEAIDVFGLHAPGPHAAAKTGGESGAAPATTRDTAPADGDGERTYEFSWAGNDSDGDGGGDSGGDGGGGD